MNLSTLSLAVKGANSALNYLRDNGKKKEREIYDSLLEAVREGNLDDLADNANQDELEELFSTARREAGDVTRDIHNRLDRRRAAFAAAAPDRKARQEALKHDLRFQEEKKGSGAGKVIATVLGIAGAAAASWAVWEFWLKDKLNEDSSETTKRTSPAPTRTETDSRGSSTLVYSTRAEDETDETAGTVRNEPDNDMRPNADMRGAAGPLGEEPAQRDEELLASIDEQLTTLDALDDDQREGTAPRHEQGGKHELNPDREVDNR